MRLIEDISVHRDAERAGGDRAMRVLQ